MLPGKHIQDTEPPPFLGTWPRVYGAVLLYLTVLLVLLYTLTRIFHY